MRGSVPDMSAGVDGIVGSFLGDIDVVGVGLPETGGGDLHELGVLLPLEEFEHNILHHLEQVDGIVLRCREEMIHQAGKDSLPL